MLSQTAEYALRAAVCMARDPDRLLTTSRIADLTLVPSGYLSKVLQALSRSELVEATRGLHGGYKLSRPPGEVSILQVVNAVDPLKRIRACPLNLKEHRANLCPLHRRLDDAIAEVERALSSTTLDELVEDLSAAPLCTVDGAQ